MNIKWKIDGIDTTGVGEVTLEAKFINKLSNT